MTRGPSWDAFELQIAARAYKIATQNRIRGADQKKTTFGDHILKLIKELQPHDLQDTDLRYGNRANGRVSILRHLKDKVFPDLTKFGKRLLSIITTDPTGGCSEKDKHCMAIANHKNWVIGMSYDYCSFGSKAFNPAEKWNHYLAWMELRLLAKFDICPQTSIIDNHNQKVSSIEKAKKLQKHKGSMDMDDDSDADDDDDSDSDNNNDKDNDNLPIQEENCMIDSEDDEIHDENDENMIPQNAAASISYNTPARTKDKNNNNNNNSNKNREKGGIKKAKLEVKQKHQFDAGLKAINSFGQDITKLANNVDYIRDVITQKKNKKMIKK
jgi:hypothetical protein